MSEENNAVVAPSDSTETQVNPNESEVAAKPAEGGDEGQQGTQEQGEQEHDRKRKGGWQRKIERLEQEREFLMQELLKRGSQPEQKPAEVSPSVNADDPEPDESQFDTMKEYVKAQAKWEARQLLKEERANQVKQQQEESKKSEEQKLFERWNTELEAAREKYDDMDELLEVPVFPSDPNKRAFMQNELLRSENPIELARYLATHIEEARAMANQSEMQIVRAFGRIEAQFAKQESAEEVKKEVVAPPPVTKAPKPPAPVTKATGTKTTDIYDPNLPFSEYKKARMAQLNRTK